MHQTAGNLLFLRALIQIELFQQVLIPLRSFNATECAFSLLGCDDRIVWDLAKLLQRVIPDTTVQYVKNPRKELAGNDLVVKNDNFLAIGLEPIFLSDEATLEVYGAVKKLRERLDVRHVLPKSFW